MSLKGEDITISLDRDLQKFSVNRLSEHRAGSIVVIEVETGEILSMASVPNFDSNLVVQKPNQKY